MDPARRGSKTLVARSECTFNCKDDDTLDRCIEAIKQSDDALRNNPLHHNIFGEIGIEAHGLEISHWKLVGQGSM